MFLPLICFVLLLFCPESPSWLLSKGNEIEARKSLQKLRGANHEKMIESELFRISSNLSNRQGHIFLRAQAYISPDNYPISVTKIFVPHPPWRAQLHPTYLWERKGIYGLGNRQSNSKSKTEFIKDIITDYTFLKPFSIILFVFCIGYDWTGLAAIQMYTVPFLM